MNLKPTKAGVVATVVVLLAIGVPGKLAFGMRDSARNEAAAVEDDTQQQLVTLAQARKLKARVPEMTARLATIRQAMPADPELQDTIDSLSKLAADSNCLWQSANVAVPSALQREAAKAEAAASKVGASAAPTDAAAVTDTTVAPSGADASSSDAGDGSGTDVTGVAVNPVDPYELSIEVSCAPETIGVYLSKVRDLERIVTIEKLSLSVKQADAREANVGADGTVLQASLTLRAYSWLAGRDTKASTTDAPATEAGATGTTPGAITSTTSTTGATP